MHGFGRHATWGETSGGTCFDLACYGVIPDSDEWRFDDFWPDSAAKMLSP